MCEYVCVYEVSVQEGFAMPLRYLDPHTYTHFSLPTLQVFGVLWKTPSGFVQMHTVIFFSYRYEGNPLKSLNKGYIAKHRYRRGFVLPLGAL